MAITWPFDLPIPPRGLLRRGILSDAQCSIVIHDSRGVGGWKRCNGASYVHGGWEGNKTKVLFLCSYTACFHLTSKFSSRPLRLCMVLPSWSIVSLGSRGKSPMVFLPYSFRLEPWPRDLPCDDSSAAASQRASLELSSLMVPCWLTMVSFCCRMVSLSWMIVFRSSSSTGLLLWTRFPVGPYPQPGSAPGGIALHTKRLPVASWLRTARPATRYNSPTTKASILTR